MVCLCLAFIKKRPLANESTGTRITLNKKYLWIFGILFLLCILSVLKLVSCYITLACVILGALLTDKKLLLKADYILLITFVFFFIFAGNIARIPEVYTIIENVLAGREVLSSALISQVISNVPAAAMLASFTDNGRALVLGTNIGGLGTVIASMASLISYRFITQEKQIPKGRYMLSFTLYNFAMLLVLLLIFV